MSRPREETQQGTSSQEVGSTQRHGYGQGQDMSFDTGIHPHLLLEAMCSIFPVACAAFLTDPLYIAVPTKSSIIPNSSTHE